MNNYQPNYYFVNGLSFPDTASDADTLVAMADGEDVAVRFINAGAIASPMHFHGYHCRVATRNRVPETQIVEKDTTLVRIGDCVDVIVPVDQPGVFPPPYPLRARSHRQWRLCEPLWWCAYRDVGIVRMR